MDEVVDSLAIGQSYQGDQRVILFVQLVEGTELDEVLMNKIRSELRSKASPRHAPSIIHKVPDIPYTFSGKKVESAVTNILQNRPVSNAGAMRNPESLEYYRKVVSIL